MIQSKHIEKTAADQTAIGFEYQYYYFLNSLLSLKIGEKIGLEVKDDVHIEYSNGNQSFFQLKHSVQKNSKGEIINLRESDLDVWKTIYNWMKIINDPVSERIEIEQQLEFIEKTNFFLITNKNESETNFLLKNLKKLKDKHITVKDFTEFLENLHKEKKNDIIQNTLKELLEQKEKWLKAFLLKIKVVTNFDNLIDRIKQNIKEKFLGLEQIDRVFSSLDSNLRKDNYLKVKRGEKVYYSFDDFYRKYTKCFEIGRTKQLKMRSFEKFDIPHELELEKQKFVEQLVGIKVLDKLDQDYKEEVLEKTIAKFRVINNLEEWSKNGDILITDLEEIKKEAMLLWKKEFKHCNFDIIKKLRNKENILEAEYINFGEECYYKTINNDISFEGYSMGQQFSEGQYYLMSDNLRIGWRYDWKEKYSKDEQ